MSVHCNIHVTRKSHKKKVLNIGLLQFVTREPVCEELLLKRKYRIKIQKNVTVMANKTRSINSSPELENGS